MPLKPGDIVYLRSGGIFMTVNSAVETRNGVPAVNAVWIDCGVRHEGWFAVDALARDINGQA